MNQNIKIAKELIKLAKNLLASEEKVNLVMDNNGNVFKVSDQQFNKHFISCRRNAADNELHGRTIIYVSPCVNATNPPGKGIKGVFTRIQNTISTILNKLSSKRKIFDVVLENENSNRGKEEGVYHLGCTIEKSKGVYPSGPQNKIYVEDSYVVTIYDATKEETDRIAVGLKNTFAQESVLVEYNGDIISHYQF